MLLLDLAPTDFGTAKERLLYGALDEIGQALAACPVPTASIASTSAALSGHNANASR